MFGHKRHWLSAAALLAIMGCGKAKPPMPVTRLGSATDSLPTSFSEVTEGAWLGGDRWAVLAPVDEAAALADPGSNGLRKLGGRGAEEIRNPSTLFRAGDSIYVGDWGLRRTTTWTLEGRRTGSLSVSEAQRGVLPRARDASGRFYYEISPRPGADGLGNRDSSVVVRAEPGSAAVDTLARLAPADLAQVVGDAGTRFERRVFSGADRWGVLPDGSLWVARVYDNRVDWRDSDGSWRRGEALPDRVLEVTRYDRELFLRKFPKELRGTAEQLPFAAVKPPFEWGLTGAGGEVWLEKSRAPIDSARHYQVVDRRGRLRREIHLSGPGRIVAVGDGAVLATEPARNGIRLLRFTIPPETAAP